MEENNILSHHLDDHLQEINEYVMLRLYPM